MRKIIYLLLIVSISYNIYAGTKLAIQIFESMKYRKESTIIKNITLKEAHEELIKKLNEESPGLQIQDLVCVCFISHPFSYSDKFYFQDTTFARLSRNSEKEIYKGIDSLANTYKDHVTFVAAFQRTDDITNETIIRFKKNTQNIIYLNGMNRLFSGYINNKNANLKRYPTIFILDKNGNMVFDCTYHAEQVYFISQFLKTLPK